MEAKEIRFGWWIGRVLQLWSCLMWTDSGVVFIGPQKFYWFWLFSFGYENSTYHSLVPLTTSEVCLAGFTQTRMFLNPALNVVATWGIVDEDGKSHFLSIYAMPTSLLGTFHALTHKNLITPHGRNCYLHCTCQKTDSEECSNMCVLVKHRLEPILVLTQSLYCLYYICGVQARYRTVYRTQRHRYIHMRSDS